MEGVSSEIDLVVAGETWEDPWRYLSNNITDFVFKKPDKGSLVMLEFLYLLKLLEIIILLVGNVNKSK